MDEDKLYEYSFQLMSEKDIAANFIWAGIVEINKIKNFQVDIPEVFSHMMDEIAGYSRGITTFSESNQYLIGKANQDKVFTALYHFAIGIERIQKTILKLYLYPNKNYDKRDYKLLTKHNVESLSQRLVELFPEFHFSKQQIEFLEFLSQFYNKERYMNYHEDSEEDKYYHRFIEYLKKYLSENSASLTNRQEVLELIGNTVGSIVAKYHSLIKKVSQDKNIYLDEIDYTKQSRYVYYVNLNPRCSLQVQYNKIKRAKEELLFFLIKNGKDIYSKDMLTTMEALDFDPVEVPDMVEYILNENVLDDFTDNVENFYDVMVEDYDEVEDSSEIAELLNNRRNFLDNFYKEI